LDYTNDVISLIYEGLLNRCTAYDTVPQLYSWGDPKTLDSVHCILGTNIYGQSYVDTLRIDQYWEHQAWNGKHKIEFKIDIDVNEVFRTVDSSHQYRIEFHLTSKERYVRGVYPGLGVQTLPGNPTPTQSELYNAQHKILSFEYSGAQIDSLEDNGSIKFHLLASWADNQPWDKFVELTNIRVYKIRKNTTVPIAERIKRPYLHGFQSQLRDDEVYGSGNSYSAEYWQYDPRLGRRWNMDPVIAFWESSYASFRNNPIYFTDPSGAIPKWIKQLGRNIKSLFTNEKWGSKTDVTGKVKKRPDGDMKKTPKRRRKPKNHGGIEGPGIVAKLGGLRGKYFRHNTLTYPRNRNPFISGSKGPPTRILPPGDVDDDETRKRTYIPVGFLGGSGEMEDTADDLMDDIDDVVNNQLEGQTNDEVVKVKIAIGSDLYHKVHKELKKKLKERYRNASSIEVKPSMSDGADNLDRYSTGNNTSLSGIVEGTPMEVEE